MLFRSLGGSAPAVIVFTAYVTEAVIHDEWQMSADPEFQTIDYRWNEREVEYSFEDEGTYYVRYIGSNADGSCEVYGDTYTVSIGASELRIPNAFTPNGDGVNDVWKVAYRSLLDFKCICLFRCAEHKVKGVGTAVSFVYVSLERDYRLFVGCLRRGRRGHQQQAGRQ